MRKLIPVFLLPIVFFYSNTLYSQSCFADNFAGPDTTLPCGLTCITLKVKVPDIRTTEDYSVKSIPYTPYAYITGAAGLTHPCTGSATSAQDDKYFDFTTLPFNFCFYSSTYNKLVIGSNGAISFNAAEALLGSTYSMTNPIPFGGTGGLGSGACPSPSGTNYPRPGIFGLYHDIWPVVGDPYKIEARMEGRIPCRRFVISYSQIKLFNCTNVTATFQVVIYENTNIIEVYVQDKPVCSATNARAIIGIQNSDLSKFSSPPGRNLFQNDTHNEAWQFTPNGANSLLSSVELRQGGAVIATGVIGTTANGLVDISFPNICPASLPSNYTVRAYYQPCDDNISPYFIEDDIAITTGNSLGATAVTTPANCANPTGTITINVPPGIGVPPFQYSLNGGPLQLSNVFSGLAANTYTVVVQDAGGCQQTLTVVVPSVTGLTGTSSITATSCPGVNNGTITITPTSGTAPYQYSLNGGPNQGSNIFSNLAPATYNISYSDANGCIGTLTATVAAGAAITATASSTDASCAGVNNGSITITPTSGTAPYQYSADGGPFQLSNTLTGLATGNHAITFKDVNGCTGTMTVFVGVGSGILFTTIVTPPSCAGAANGAITVNPSSGTSPYSYSINGGPSQLSNVFTGLAAATYTISISDGSGCTGSSSIVMPAGAGGLTANAVPVGTSCPGVNNGSITINPANGMAPYQYSLNGGPFQLSNTFNNLAAGTYTVNLKDAINCSGTLSITVAAGVNLIATSAVVNPPCAGINNGSITITPTTGTTPYLYSFNGGAFLPVNTFTGLAAPANYTIDFTDAIGCSGTITVPLTANTAISTTIAKQEPLCFADANGTVTFSPSGGVSPFQFSKDGGITYQASDIFNGLTAGTYNFRIRDNLGCTKDSAVTLNQPVLLTAAASSTPSSCNGNDGVISLTAGGGTPGYLYSIDNGISYQAGSIFTVAPATYNNIIIKDANGCTKPAAVTVTLVDNMFLNAGADTTVCVGSGVTLQPLTNPETNIFDWSPATGLSSSTIKNPVASPTDTATYYLNFTWGACNRKDTIRVNVLHKPVANAGKDTAICYKTTALLKGAASNLSGPVTYAWAPAGMVLNPTAASTTARPDSSQLFTLTVKDNYGCNFSVTDNIFVTMQPPVPAHAGNDTNAIYGVPHQLFSSGGVSYLWSPASPLNNPFAQNPLATLTNDTYFNVQVTDVAGCIGNDGVFIKVYKGPTYYLPNAFSPNGDGLNEKFRPIPVGIKSTEYFRIYNRYGQLLFESNKWLDGWDGKYLGKPQQTGAYVWLIKGVDKDGKAVEMKGQVMLIR